MGLLPVQPKVRRCVHAQPLGDAGEAVAAHHRGRREARGDALRQRRQPGGAAGEVQRIDPLVRHARPGAACRRPRRRCARRSASTAAMAWAACSCTLQAGFDRAPGQHACGRPRPRRSSRPRPGRPAHGPGAASTTVISRAMLARVGIEALHARQFGHARRRIDGVDQVPGGQVEVDACSAPRARPGRGAAVAAAAAGCRPARRGGRSRCRRRARRGWPGCRPGARHAGARCRADAHQREVRGAAADVGHQHQLLALAPWSRSSAPRRSARTGSRMSSKPTSRAACSSAACAAASRSASSSTKNTGRPSTSARQRLPGLGFGARASGAAGSRRPRRGSAPSGRRRLRWTAVASVEPRMLFIERISRPSMPST